MNSDNCIKLIGATYTGGYKVDLQFADHTVAHIDFGKFLFNHPHPQYDKYRRLSNFKKFKIDRNNLVWGRNWDLIFDLEKLYQGISPQ
jgi:hypothetical protein